MDSTGAAVPGATVRLLLHETAATATQATSADGRFVFAGIQPGRYQVKVELAGFAPAAVTDVKVDTARETTIPTITIQPAALTQTVDVTAGINSVQTSNAEITTTVTNGQLRRLPQLNRNILALVATQPGVGSNGRTGTTINGLRVSYANVTLDGVNIQDNYFRETSLDFQPNLLLLDQIGEVTISSSNSNVAAGGGATQVSFTTPSGTNQFHGAAYWYNRNNALAANGWFENRNGNGIPFLNQNQAGGWVGGPIIKNKLFFYSNFEAFRRRQQTQVLRTILTDSARQGVFTYVDRGNNVVQRNILQLTGQRIDPAIQTLLGETPGGGSINNFSRGDSREGLLRNTGGYKFLSSNNRDRDNVTGKLDYYVSDRHSIFGSYIWNRDRLDRPTVTELGYSSTPTVVNDNAINFASMGWRSTWSPTMTNELRFGFNLAPGNFVKVVPTPAYFVDGLVFSNPVQTYMPEGRTTNTWNLADNANWLKGKHSLKASVSRCSASSRTLTTFSPSCPSIHSASARRTQLG